MTHTNTNAATDGVFFTLPSLFRPIRQGARITPAKTGPREHLSYGEFYINLGQVVNGFFLTPAVRRRFPFFLYFASII